MKKLIYMISLNLLIVVGLISIIFITGCVEDPEHTNPIDPETSEAVREKAWSITVEADVNSILVKWEFPDQLEIDKGADIYIHRLLKNQNPDKENSINNLSISSGIYEDKDLPGSDKEIIKYSITLSESSLSNSNVYKILASSEEVEMKIDQDKDGVLGRNDCNDNEAEEYPNGTEKCDGYDNDCDGTVDNGLTPPGHCHKEGVCAGTDETCKGSTGWECIYPETYQVEGETECDGQDNDCDGETDENLTEPGNCKTIGVCQGTSEICEGETGWVCNYDDKYEMEEILCDGLDNDCDGETDEDLKPPEECNQKGVCNGTTESCDGESGWICHYTNSYEQDETNCDFKDNDCDGETDEGLRNTCDGCGNFTESIGDKCDGDDNDKCKNGTLTCSEDGGSLLCVNETVINISDICNGEDDDCDGETDEGDERIGSECDIEGGELCTGATYKCNLGELLCLGSNCVLTKGVCKGSTKRCQGAWLECTADDYGPDYQFVENICDNMDNDCDGRTDEGFDQDNDGYTSCGGDCDDSKNTVYMGYNEECDLLDNDCDGETDEGFDKDSDGYTSCGGDCDDNEYSINPESDEECDSIDNDCDGNTDEDYLDLGTECKNGTGECIQSGVKVCKYDGTGTECNAVPEDPIAELCDGLDNDCNGIADNGWPLGQQCGSDGHDCGYGVLECASESSLRCSTDQGGSQDYKEEVCDGRDNDCDGDVDEDFNQDNDNYTSCGGDCDDGNNSINPDAEEICDNVDNDCDGEIDEGEDKDNDGYSNLCDCDDNNPNKHVYELCNDNIDNDCDGETDEGGFLELPSSEIVSFSCIKAGTFTMGSSSGDSDEKPVHEVTLTHDFEIQTTELTQGQWKAAFGSNPSNFSSCGDDCPVETINWYEALHYANWLSEQEGYTPCYVITGCNSNCVGCDRECSNDVKLKKADGTEASTPYECEGYRLPTEAEWEYAIRAGTTTAYYCGDSSSCLSDIAWYSSNSGSKTHEAGQKDPNDWGLYDMSGNVWEWVWDWYNSSYSGDVTNPDGPYSVSYRVLRGGGWDCYGNGCRSANRSNNSPGARGDDYGVRFVRSYP